MVSDSQPCDTLTECRSSEEMKHLAGCKAKKLSTVIKKQQVSLFYIMTQFIGKSKTEWSKYVYSYVDKSSNSSKPGYLRICVPVDSSKNAWVDDRCPLDECGEFSFFSIIQLTSYNHVVSMLRVNYSIKLLFRTDSNNSKNDPVILYFS